MPPERRWSGAFPYGGVSFDIDGTLYRLRPFKWQLVLRRLRDLGAWITLEDVRRQLRRASAPPPADLDAAITRAVARRLRQPEDATAALLRRMIREDWPALLARVGPAPGAVAALSALRDAGVPMVAFSDYPGVEKLAALGLTDFPWVDVLDATALGALKPAPDAYRAAAAALRLPPARVLHVGDSLELDVRGANAIGMASALLGRSRRPPGPPVEPTWRFASMAAFAQAVTTSLVKELPP